MNRIPIAASISILACFGCGGTSTTTSPFSAKSTAAEAPVGALKALAKALESPKAVDRKKAADEIAKLGPPARPLQEALKRAMDKESDAAVKAALTTALEKVGG
jgi:hypothetical protein